MQGSLIPLRRLPGRDVRMRLYGGTGRQVGELGHESCRVDGRYLRYKDVSCGRWSVAGSTGPHDQYERHYHENCARREREGTPAPILRERMAKHHRVLPGASLSVSKRDIGCGLEGARCARPRTVQVPTVHYKPATASNAFAPKQGRRTVDLTLRPGHRHNARWKGRTPRCNVPWISS
jgi:hypothetical protein